MVYQSLEDAFYHGTSMADPVAYVLATGNLDELYDDHQGHRIALLHQFIMIKSKEAVEFLISKGANVNLPTSDGDTPLFMALILKDFDIVRILVEHGADVNAPEPVQGNTPLHCALTESLGDIAQYLLAHGANPDVRNKAGIPPRQIGLFNTLTRASSPTVAQGNSLDDLFNAFLQTPGDHNALVFLDLLQTLLPNAVQQGQMSSVAAQRLDKEIDEFKQELSRPSTGPASAAAKQRRLSEIAAEAKVAVTK
jgi:hypothetical protein